MQNRLIKEVENPTKRDEKERKRRAADREHIKYTIYSTSAVSPINSSEGIMSSRPLLIAISSSRTQINITCIAYKLKEKVRGVYFCQLLPDIFFNAFGCDRDLGSTWY